MQDVNIALLGAVVVGSSVLAFLGARGTLAVVFHVMGHPSVHNFVRPGTAAAKRS